MLKPALLYKDLIERITTENMYNDHFYEGYTIAPSRITIDDSPEQGVSTRYDWAIVNENDNLLGLFTYWYYWYDRNLIIGRLVNLIGHPDMTIGLDVIRHISKFVTECNVHRIEWRMVGGNPVQRSYDNLIKRYGGKKHVLTDVLKDRNGNYHSEHIYEIIFKE